MASDKLKLAEEEIEHWKGFLRLLNSCETILQRSVTSAELATTGRLRGVITVYSQYLVELRPVLQNIKELKERAKARIDVLSNSVKKETKKEKKKKTNRYRTMDL